MAIQNPKPGQIGWFLLEGYPWWPVYICDPHKLRMNLHSLGSNHGKVLKKARDFPSHFGIVYFFGSHDFSSVHLKKPVLKPWDCSEKEEFMKGFPAKLAKSKVIADLLISSLQEVDTYLAEPEDIRLPPHMVPSDLDPSLEPPPPAEENSGAGEDDEEEINDESARESTSGEDSDTPSSKKDKKKQKKRKAKVKDRSDSKKKQKTHNSKVKDDRKNSKKRALSGEQIEESSGKKKKISSDRTNDMKVSNEKGESQSGGEKMVKLENTGSVDSKTLRRPSPNGLSAEELANILEKEIHFIMLNCPYEEMTMKTVRKMLEERLNMNLGAHKASIKESVTRVINSMDEIADSNEADAQVADKENSTSTQNGDKTENLVDQNMEIKKEIRSDLPKISEERIAEFSQVLTNPDASNEQLLDCLSSLAQQERKLVQTVSQLRQHANDKVAIAASNLRNKWKQLKDVNSHEFGKVRSHNQKLEELNEQLEQYVGGEMEGNGNAELEILNQLFTMSLSTQEILESRIAATVNKLRKSSNGAIASAAIKLRKKWKSEVV